MKVNIDDLTMAQIKQIQEISCQKSQQLGKYVIVRTCGAGVFAGYFDSKNGNEVVLRKARRLWQWSGAASLSQLAMEGVKHPDQCKFPTEVDRVELLNVVEIIDATEAAKNSIASVKIWSA